MFYVICPTSEGRVEIPTNAIGTGRTDPWNVARCDECHVGFDYDDEDVLSDQQAHN